MGLLESAIGGVLGQVFGGRQGGAQGGAMSPLVKALLMLLLAKGASGGFGDIFGGGHRREPEADRPDPAPRPPVPGPRDGGDIGGFDQWGGRREAGPDTADSSLPPGDFSDLSGMLDGPGSASPRTPDPDARPGRAPDDGPDLGGLDGLIEGFRKGGLGDVIGSWIGHGPNSAIAPSQLAQALGSDTVETLERETGMGRDALLAQLAEVLPQVIDGLTPHGRVPGDRDRQGW